MPSRNIERARQQVLCWTWCKPWVVHAWLVCEGHISRDFCERHLFMVWWWIFASSETNLFKHLAKLHCRRPHSWASSTVQHLERWYSIAFGGLTLTLGLAYWILLAVSETYIFFSLPSIEKSNKRPYSYLNTLRPRQTCRHIADDILNWIFLNENVWILLKISLKFVPMVRINIIPVSDPIMAWRRPGDKPLSGPRMVWLLMHICVTRPQRVNTIFTKYNIW